MKGPAAVGAAGQIPPALEIRFLRLQADCRKVEDHAREDTEDLCPPADQKGGET